MKRDRRLFLPGLFTGLFVVGIGTTVCSPILIEMSASLGSSVDRVGAVFSLGPVGFLFGLAVSLPAVRALGERRVLGLSCALGATGAGIVAVAGNLPTLCAGMVVLSLGSSLLMSRSLALLGNTARSDGRLRLGMGTFSISLGAVLGAYLGPLAAAAGLGWPVAFWTMAAVLAADLVLLQAAALPAGTGRGPDDSRPRIGALLGSLRGVVVLVMGMAVFLVFALELGISAWIPTILRLTRGFDLSAAGNTLAVFWISMAAGRLIFGLLAGRCHLLAVSLALSALFLLSLLATLAAVPGCTILFFGLCGFFITALYTYALIIATELAPNHKSLVVTAFLVLGEVGFLSTNSLIVALIGAYGIGSAQNLFLAAGTLLILTLAAACVLSTIERRRSAEAIEEAPGATA